MIWVELIADELVAGEVADLVVRLHNKGQGDCSNVVFKLRLPSQIALLRGNDRVEVNRLAAGDTTVRTLRVRPTTPGTCQVTSGNFSYRDHNGVPRRVADFVAGLTVSPPRPAAAPVESHVVVELVTQRLPYREWETLRGRVRNAGEASVHDVAVHVDGPFTSDWRTAKRNMGTLLPGHIAEFDMYVCFSQFGGRVPVHTAISLVDDAGRTQRLSQTIPVRVDSGAESGSAGKPAARRIRVLYLSANPSDATRLRVDTELREIRETLRLGNDRDAFDLQQRVAVRARDISQALLDVSPRIVHFSGHGFRDGSLGVHGESDRISRTSAEGLADLFKVIADGGECFIVNACHSLELARAVVQHIDYVIGMKDAVGDEAAIVFSIGFYQALAASRSIEDAFRLGCAQVRMQLRGSQHETPVLLTRSHGGGR